MFKRQTKGIRRKLIGGGVAVLMLPLLGLAVWSEVQNSDGHLYRWPFNELANYVAGVRYQVNLSCPGQGGAERHTLRASDFEDATSYLTLEHPSCQLAEIRRDEQSWF